jgi:hypothetical protein
MFFVVQSGTVTIPRDHWDKWESNILTLEAVSTKNEKVVPQTKLQFLIYYIKILLDSIKTAQHTTLLKTFGIDCVKALLSLSVKGLVAAAAKPLVEFAKEKWKEIKAKKAEAPLEYLFKLEVLVATLQSGEDEKRRLKTRKSIGSITLDRC